jgi:hypothetical protein
MDGNIKAEHQKMKNPGDDIILSDGGGFFVADKPYKAHLKLAKPFVDVRITPIHF